MAERFSLQDETTTFAEKVVALVTPKMASHWRERVEKLWKDIEQRGLADRTPATKKLYMSRFRKSVRDLLATAEPDADRRKRVDADLMTIIKIDPAIQAELHEKYQAKVKHENRDLTVVSDWKFIVAASERMLESDDMEERLIALIFLTGRRFRELIWTAEFGYLYERKEHGRERQNWALNFSGQLKTGGGDGTMYAQRFAIPVLAPAWKILKAFGELRASPEGQKWLEANDGQVRSTLNNALNAKLKKSVIARLWPSDTKLSLKELRALYAEIAYVNFAPRSIRAPFYARILGHGIEDETTALSYMRFSLNTDGLREGAEEINRLIMQREERRKAYLAEHGEEAADEVVDPDE